MHWKFDLFKSRFSEKNYVVEAKNWYVWGNQGCVITDNGYVVTPVSREYDNQVHSIFQQFKLIHSKKINGTIAVIAASGANVYYHWMVDILPRIQLLKDSGNFHRVDKFILNYQGLPFQKESLKKLEIDESKLIVTNNHWSFHGQAETLLIPSFVSPLDIVSPYTINFLRNYFLGASATITNKRSRIYIKRINGRRIINEAEIEEYLLGIGFISVSLENYSIEEQAKLFNSAEYIIGAHGAGFTNLVFCEPETIVVDIFSPLWVNPCYWTIACELNLDYRYMIGEGDRPQNGIDLKGKGENIILDLEKFKKLMLI